MLRASTAAAISHQAVHVRRTFRPETYPVFAGNVGGRFCSTEEIPGHIARGLELQPSFNGHSARKRQGWEHRFAKGNYLGEPRHTQIGHSIEPVVKLLLGILYIFRGERLSSQLMPRQSTIYSDVALCALMAVSYAWQFFSFQ